MSFYEEPDEQNEQAWRTHFEQERLDLSASVEAALLDNGVLTRQWPDELDEQPVTGRTELVPPRLSLQSRLLPAVQPERIVPSTTDAQQAISYSAVEKAQEQVAPPSQPSGMFARLARRFTSSFAAIRPEMLQQQVAFPPPEQSFEEDYAPLPANRQPSTTITPIDAPLVRVVDTVRPADPVEKRTPTEPQKRRTLKRNAKVRLETTEQPAIAKAIPSPRREEQETGEALLTDVREALSRQQMASVRKEEQSATRYSTSPSAAPSFLSGSGAFESEQSDVMIVNSRITSSSVVLVTLTTNPGPVVVQYISLQPEVGFTIHLTAPVTTRTTFNYLIVPGETV
jgi:hypothetical protein